MIRRTKNYPAFTLIELLVVVAIIVVLMALLMPKLTMAKNQAVKVSCAANLRGIAMSCLLYASDNQDSFPLNSHWVGALLTNAANSNHFHSTDWPDNNQFDGDSIFFYPNYVTNPKFFGCNGFNNSSGRLPSYMAYYTAQMKGPRDLNGLYRDWQLDPNVIYNGANTDAGAGAYTGMIGYVYAPYSLGFAEHADKTKASGVTGTADDGVTPLQCNADNAAARYPIIMDDMTFATWGPSGGGAWFVNHWALGSAVPDGANQAYGDGRVVWYNYPKATYTTGAAVVPPANQATGPYMLHSHTAAWNGTGTSTWYYHGHE